VVNADLVRLAARGDQVAFESLIRLHSGELYSVGVRILRDHDAAADAAQDAIVAIWQHLPELRDPDRFEGWAYRILVRSCVSESRRRRAAIANVIRLAPPPTTEMDIGIDVANRDALERGFRALDVAHRAVVVLHHYRGMTLREVGEVLGIPTGTAYSRLHYAHRQLRGAIDADMRSSSRPRMRQ
jgi:RNA polymerase sigma-70 factor, ECF subfamily